MISILIPTYNYNIVHLVNNIHEQALKAKIEFEIIVLDDASLNNIKRDNYTIKSLSHTTYSISSTNQGIAITRQQLCIRAKYDWILLIDADVEIKSNGFLNNYLKLIDSEYDLVFGGFAYKKEKPAKDYLLRWKYGINCEEINASVRNKRPYKVTIAANVLARKKTYKNLNLDSIGNLYAMDYYFGALLKQAKIKVLHINNQVYHLGIEKSNKYLRKKEQAAETIINLIRKNKLKEHENDLLAMFITLKKTGLNYIFAFFFKLLKPFLKLNLLSQQPKVIILQFYKILYLCYFDLKTK